jgi:hypothetical protein
MPPPPLPPFPYYSTLQSIDSTNTTPTIQPTNCGTHSLDISIRTALHNPPPNTFKSPKNRPGGGSHKGYRDIPALIFEPNRLVGFLIVRRGNHLQPNLHQSGALSTPPSPSGHFRRLQGTIVALLSSATSCCWGHQTILRRLL